AINDPASDQTELKGLFNNKSLLTGIGLRISDPVRLSVGGVWNRVSAGNPIADDFKLRAYPYVSLSFDVDVGKYLGSLGSIIFGDKLKVINNVSSTVAK
ncbi:MAG: hypothetical protein RIE59_03070, partial [Imperialibacter sp.]